jgi:hypothetical protein
MYSNPEVFRPERFLLGSKPNLAIRIQKWSPLGSEDGQRTFLNIEHQHTAN